MSVWSQYPTFLETVSTSISTPWWWRWRQSPKRWILSLYSHRWLRERTSLHTVTVKASLNTYNIAIIPKEQNFVSWTVSHSRKLSKTCVLAVEEWVTCFPWCQIPCCNMLTISIEHIHFLSWWVWNPANTNIKIWYNFKYTLTSKKIYAHCNNSGMFAHFYSAIEVLRQVHGACDVQKVYKCTINSLYKQHTLWRKSSFATSHINSEQKSITFETRFVSTISTILKVQYSLRSKHFSCSLISSRIQWYN
jgi:hypothetical protein